MIDSNLTTTLIPKTAPENPGESIKNKSGDCTVNDANPPISISLEFPQNTQTIPLAGGAVVSFIYNQKVENLNTTIFFENEFSILRDLDLTGNKLDILTRLRNQINRILSNIGSKDNIRKKAGLPQVFLSTFVGDDSEFLDNSDKPIADIFKICHFDYIPLDSLKKIAEVVSSLGSLNIFNGISGIPFQSLSSAQILDLVLEFFTIYNLSENSIVNRNLFSNSGGFYTFDSEEKKIYIKLPDLSGKDSFGFASNIFQGRNFYLEVENKGKVQRAKLMDIAIPPSIDLAGDYPDEFPEVGSLTISILANKNLSRAFLSPIFKRNLNPIIPNIKTSPDGIEVSTTPLLTIPVLEGRNPTFNSDVDLTEEFKTTSLQFLKNIYADEFLNNELDFSKVGIVSNNINLGTLFGEQNRPEVLLLEGQKRNPSANNNRKYWSKKITEARPLFSNVRPKVYRNDQIPDLWLKSDKFNIDSDGNFIFNFPRSELNKIRKENLNNIAFVLYAQDSDGQLARAPHVLNLEISQPVLTSIEPTGFSDSAEISPFSLINLSLGGENLGAIRKLFFISESGQEIVFDGGVTENASVSFSNNEVRFSSHKELRELGFTATTTYSVYGETITGIKSSILKIYISDGDGGQAAKQKELVNFSNVNSLYFLNKEKRIANEIPIFSSQQAILKLKSQDAIFNGDYAIYSYFAAPKAEKDSLLYVDLPSNLVDLPLLMMNGQELELTVASSIKYQYVNSLAGEDFYKVSNRKANLKFPGTQYQARNFDALIKQNHNFYLLFTAKPLEELIAGNDFNKENYFILQLGDNENSIKAFSPPPQIIGMAAIPKGSRKIISNFSISNKYDIIYENFNISSKEYIFEYIKCFNKISNLAIVFKGDSSLDKNSRYDFFLGDTKINNKLSGKIERIENSNEYIAFFKNINISQTGDLPVYIKKRDREYKVEGSSEIINKKGTYLVVEKDLEFDQENNELIIKNIVDQLYQSTGNSGLVSKTIQEIDEILSEVFEPVGSGIALKSLVSKLNFLQEVDLTSNLDLGLSVDGESTLLSANNTQQFSNLDKNQLYIPAGTKISSENLIIDNRNNPKEAAIFLNLTVNNSQSIGFNKPSILGLSKGQLVSEKNDPELVVIEGGETYSILVESSQKNFSLIFDDNAIVLPKSIKQVGENKYKAQFIAPRSLSGKKCPKIAASITNSERNLAKFLLGNDFVIDIENKMSNALNGITKKKLPDLDDLKELIRNFPLRFTSIKLDQASVPADLINDFCDMSFHLTADLKIALNGFQVLMIPIQVIFCIIDVICSLMNPVKVARAVIRLFQCLYDLILLLPQISVPVMYLQLVLHLIMLLECVFDKVNRLATAINVVLESLQEAVNNSFWDAVKSLEETLSEYLMDLKISLSVLDPISSILGIFLQLLQLVFRFPCSITDDDEEYFCMDGTMLSGLVMGITLNSDKTYKPQVLLPVGQSYTLRTIADSISHGSSEPLVEPKNGDLCAIQNDNQTYFDIMNVDQNKLRSTYTDNNGDFNLTFAISTTKIRKGFGSPDVVQFEFNEKGKNGFFNRKKIISPDQTLDSPLYLTKNLNNKLTIDVSNNKNLISPIDGFEFLTIKSNKGSVKPLTLSVEIPLVETNEETGEVRTVGVQTVPRTFDNIPSMAILDEDYNVYFIEPDGISFNDGRIESIRAKIVNLDSAQKKSFSKEEVEIDTDSDGENDDEATVFDFPQIFFFDMREVAEDIETKCGFDFFNNDLLNDNPDDITDIVGDGQDCVNNYQNYISTLISNIRDSLAKGIIPESIRLDEIQNKNQELQSCLNNSIDQICIYVVNSLNTQFKIINGAQDTEEQVDILDDTELSGPSLTGAREYAAGIGDSAEFRIGEEALIQITPRDSYDNIILGDLSKKISLDIITDTTNSARVIEEDGQQFIFDGENYFAKITSDKVGMIKVKARVCSKTIQAVTYPEIIPGDEDGNDCVPSASNLQAEESVNGLIKIDRILTIYFTEPSTISLSQTDNSLTEVMDTEPQIFGSKLEN